MSEVKPAEKKPVTYINTPVAVKYDYTAGKATSDFMRAVAKGKIIGNRCPQCNRVYVPNFLVCVQCAVPMGEPFEVPDTGIVLTFCIVNIKFYDQVLEVPYVSAYVLLDGTDLPLMHLVQECNVKDVRMGMRVKAVWKDELSPSLESIRYFKPTGEPDAALETFKEYL